MKKKRYKKQKKTDTNKFNIYYCCLVVELVCWCDGAVLASTISCRRGRATLCHCLSICTVGRCMVVTFDIAASGH